MIKSPRSLQSRLFRVYLLWTKRHTDRVNTPIAQQRAEIERSVKMLRPARGVLNKPMTVEGLHAEWLIPPNADQSQVVLYLHGGGFSIGSCTTHRTMVSYIAAATRVPALLLDYRLAPEHIFPAALDDSLAGYHWLLKNEAKPVIIMGDSAGGGLVLSLMLKLRESAEPLPRSAVVISPFTDLTASGESAKTHIKIDPMNKPEDIALPLHYVGKNDPAMPLLSPLFGDLRGLPPLLIQVGSDEILLSDSTRLAEKARAAGVDVQLEVWQGMWHVWHIFAPLLPEANRAIQHIAEFVKRTSAANA